jgi:DNA-directed RNA polymerase subunit RPC12/RpoP
MKEKEITLPCGHVIEESYRWCPNCAHHVAQIKNGVPPHCPECSQRYNVDKYKFYRGKTKE